MVEQYTEFENNKLQKILVDGFDTHEFDNEVDIIGETQVIKEIFKNPDTIIKYLYNYSYFHSDIIHAWIKDYYLLQQNIISNEFKNIMSDVMVYKLPATKGLIMWNKNCFDCNVKFDWTKNNIGYIDFSTNFTELFDILKNLFQDNKCVFDVIIPTCFNVSMGDDYKMYFTNIGDFVTFNMSDFRNYFISPGIKYNKYDNPIDYLKNCNQYVTINDMATELNNITNNLHGYVNFLMRMGVKIDNDITDINEIINKKSNYKDGIIIEVNSNNELYNQFNNYKDNYYHKNDTYGKRTMIFRDYYNDTNKYMEMSSVSKPHKYIETYQDIKELILKIYFKDDIDKIKAFKKQYSDSDGYLTILGSIGEAVTCCEKYDKGELYVKDENNDELFDIKNEIVKELFFNVFNHENNQYIKQMYEKAKAKE